MAINEKGRFVSGILDERGRRVFGSLDERSQSVFGTAGATIIQGELWQGNSTGTSNFNMALLWEDNWHDSRHEQIVLKADLQALGLQAGDKIKELRFNVTEIPTSNVVDNVRIAIKHTTDTAFTAGTFANHPYSSFTEVYYRASEPFDTIGWKSFVFDTPFTWNGNDNIIIHDSKDTNDYSGGGTAGSVSVGANRGRGYYADSDTTFPYDSATATQFLSDAYRTYVVAERMPSNKYLSMDGINDSLQLPTMTLRRIVIDGFFPQQASNRILIDSRTGQTNGYVYANTDGSLTTAGATFQVTNYVMDARREVTFNAINNIDGSNNFTDNVTIFSNNSGGEYFMGSIYSVKCYNASNTLVAHYDMSTGTTQDQTGNGNHATLNGGTWVTEPSAHLELDGVDDYILTPSMTFDKVVFDFVPKTTTGSLVVFTDFAVYAQLNSPGTWELSGVDSRKNGVFGATPAVGERSFIAITGGQVTRQIPLFARANGAYPLGADVYNVKIYNGTTLVAHYDMTSGSVQDRSGNERHATLNGGTWINGTSGTSEALEGSSTSSSNTNGATLKATSKLEGNTTASVTATAPLKAGVKLAGSTTASATDTASLTIDAPVIEALAGTSTSSSSTGNATLKNTSKMVGTSLSVSNATNLGLVGYARMGGTSLSTATASSALLRATTKLAGNTTASATTSAPLKATNKLAGNTTASATTSQPDLVVMKDGGIAGSSVSSSSTSTTPLKVKRRFTAVVVTGTSTTTGTARVRRRVIATTTAVSGGSGTLGRQRVLGGTLSAVSGSTSRLSKRTGISGNTQATSHTLTALLKAMARMSASEVITSNVTGRLGFIVKIAGTSQSSVSATGRISSAVAVYVSETELVGLWRLESNMRGSRRLETLIEGNHQLETKLKGVLT